MSKLTPTIILDEPSARLRDEVAAFAPVFVFRPSRGFLSSPISAAEELPAMLAAAGTAPPYVFVAASFGGFMALAYAARHPETLAGLVLVDASHPGQSASALAAIPADTAATPRVTEFKRTLQGFGEVWTEGCAAIAKINHLGDLPLIVLAAGKPDMPDEMSPETRAALARSWHDLQRKHAVRSTRGELRLVEGAGHDLVRLAPQAVLAAIRRLALPAPAAALNA